MSIANETLRLEIDEHVHVFQSVRLNFGDATAEFPVWALKNNKTVWKTLEHPRYSRLREVLQPYDTEFDQPLGSFLNRLRERGDERYRLFLNEDGDEPFCTFRLEDTAVAKLRGIYLFRLGGDIVYIGRCLDSFGKRINQGYGRIHPRNCYLDGQRTNCRINALVARNRAAIEFFICSIDSDQEIVREEIRFLQRYRPAWNRSYGQFGHSESARR